MTTEEKYNDVCKALLSVTFELDVYKKALKLACNNLTSINCDTMDCPMRDTGSRDFLGTKEICCPDCEDPNVWKEYFLQKARE